MTSLQRAYTVGRLPELPLGGVECLAYFEFRGRRLDATRLQQAVDRVHRHAALRARFTVADTALLEDGCAPAPRIRIHDVKRDPAGGRAEIRERMMHSTVDIGLGINWDAALSTAGDNCTLHLVFSLAAIDVAAIGVVLHEMAQTYSDSQGPGETIETLSALQEALKERSRPRSARRRHDSPALLPGPELAGLFEGVTDDKDLTTLRHEFSQREWEELLGHAKDYEVSPAALILAVYERALRRWSSNDDFCVTVAALDIRGTEALVTDRTVAYAHRAFGAVDFEQEVASVASDLRRRLVEHRDVMTEMREAQAAGTPVAASRCVFTYAAEMTVFSPLVLEVFGQPRSWGQTPQSAIDCRIIRLNDDTLEVAFDIRTSAMPLRTSEAIFELFIQNLVEIIETGYPRTYLPHSQARIRDDLNSTPPTSPHLLYDAFRSQVAKQPDAIAVAESRRCGQTSLESGGLSYAELDQRALTLGALIAQSAPPGSLVAVQLPRGINQIIAILGILYAGCAYLPISHDAPEARIERIRERSQWSLLLTQEFLAQETSTSPLRHPIPVGTRDLAYVIFTSGSTGDPKGVAITHAAAANTIADVNARNGIGPHDRFLAVSGIDFDLSVYDIFGALGAGGQLFLVSDSDNRDPFTWGDIVRRCEITVWNSVPLLLEMLATANTSLPSLRSFLISGDRIPLDLPARSRTMSPGSTFVAMGGATEGSIWSNEYVINNTTCLEPDWPSVPYGRPLTGQKYRVVDTQGIDLPDGSVGELLIGGAGVARGYYRDPERTAVSFVNGPDGGLWYRTGDLGMWHEGLLFFAGRKDTQVKIRGHRVECGEVESRLCDHPAVSSAAIVPIRDRSALAALYVPATSDSPPDPSILSAYLASQLPWYMVPAAFRPADELPMTANGKVDRRMVAALFTEQDHHESPEPDVSRGRVDALVADSWARVLGRRVAPDSNFFALGGDSLAATRMCAQLRESGLRANLASLFRSPVLSAFTATCETGGEDDEASMAPGRTAGRLNWREQAAADDVSLSSLGLAEWCRWVWAHELGTERAAITDDADFFVLGGDSLTGARVCADLRMSGVDAAVADLFRHPSFGEFWRRCTFREDTDGQDEPAAQDSDVFDLTPLQLAYALGSDGVPGVVRTSPCVAVIITSNDQRTSARWSTALNEVVARHEALRLVRYDDWRQRVVPFSPAEFVELPFALSDVEFRDLLSRTRVDSLAAPAVRGFVRKTHPHELGLVFNYLALDSLSIAAILCGLAEIALGIRDTVEPQDISAFRRYAHTRNGSPGSASIPAPAIPRVPTNPIPNTDVVFASHGHELAADHVQRLRNLARQHGVTLNSVFLQAYSSALTIATGQSQITVNIPTAHRPAETPEALGQFSDLALCQCDSGMGLREIHAQLGLAIAQAGMVAAGATTQRQRYPVVFTSLLGSPLAENLAGGLVRVTWMLTRTPAVLIDCQVMPMAHNGIELRWDYPRHVIPEDFVSTAFEHFTERVHAMGDLPEAVG